MVYFDNAATGGFKPYFATEAAINAIRYLNANPGRSGHRLSITGAEIVYGAREELAITFNSTPERVIFTKNCTESLNQAIFGTVKKGGHIITTIFEHNSVLRPLTYLKEKGEITFTAVKEDELNSLEGAIENALLDNTYAVILTACSNVTGQITDIKRIGEFCKKHSLLFIVDGAQGGGHFPIDIIKNNISILCLASHKGLYGIMGSGVMILNEDIKITPLIFGGTGTDSFNLNQPKVLPEYLESGTLNLPAISALRESVRYVRKNLDNFSSLLLDRTDYLIKELSTFKEILVYSKKNPAGIVSFSISGLPSGEVADILNSSFDIAVRGGYHCAPLTHEYLKTKKDGLVRVSLCAQNSSSEINYFLSAIKKIILGI